MKEADPAALETHCQVEGGLDSTLILGKVIGFQVMGGDDGTSLLQSRLHLPRDLPIWQPDQHWIIPNELTHDIGLTSDGRGKLILTHSDPSPSWVQCASQSSVQHYESSSPSSAPLDQSSFGWRGGRWPMTFFSSKNFNNLLVFWVGPSSKVMAKLPGFLHWLWTSAEVMAESRESAMTSFMYEML